MTDIQGDAASAGDKVFLVSLMPPDGLNSTSFTESMLRMFMHDTLNGQHLTAPMFLSTTPMRIASNRNMACKTFLEETDAGWLLFVDSDMGWSEDAVEALLAVADPAERPVVGALCFGMRKEEVDGKGGFRSVPFPTLFDWKLAAGAERPGFQLRYDYTPDTVTQVSATGAAFLLIHRSALEKVRMAGGDVWFDRAKMYPDDEQMGEDISFCSRLGMLGIPIFVHTGVRTTHLKPMWVGEDSYLAARALAAADSAEASDE
jgi:GT2 family glycosyltransferase